jgi:mono/diheme cytochrome c family protein
MSVRRFAILLSVILSVVCGGIAGSAAAETSAPAAEEFAPGLKLTFSANGKTDARPARLIALNVPANTPATPFLEAGPFAATWEGLVNLRIRGEYTFLPVGSGGLKVFIGEKLAFSASGEDFTKAKSEPVKLTKGKNKIRVEYTSPEKGDAIFRLYWSERGPAEPVSPMLLVHDAKDADLRTKWDAHEGRALFGELRCVKCHADAELSKLDAEVAMPELSQDAPDLSQVPFRLNQNWIAAWIANPRQINPRAEMPRVFSSAEKDAIGQEAADLASYLVQVKGAVPSIPAPAPANEGQIQLGQRLYANLGCIGCHTPPDFEGADAVTPARIPHKHIRAKYNLGALVGFLKSPQEHFRWIRMPDFHLSDEEAQALGQYLYYKSPELSLTVPEGNAARGKQLFASSGCLNCHTAEGNQNAAQAPALLAIQKSDHLHGCLAADEAGWKKAPDFSLNDEQRAALGSFLATDLQSLKRDVPIEFAERRIAQLNCAACHPRDKQDDTFSTLSKDVAAMLAALPPEGAAGEHFAPDQGRPPLTWIGEKLRPEWMESFIAGKVAYKPRPWLRARMPAFMARARGLAVGLALEHGFGATTPALVKPDPELAPIGQKLAGKNGGFSCVQCHAVGEQKALAPFEAPAPNFAYVTERLRREYYERWMMKPQRVLPGTRMPDFADSEGKTPLKNVFDGDAHKQFEALWNYLLTGAKIEPPAQ